jgi:hypothetical protein
MPNLVAVDFDPFGSDQSANSNAIASIESGGNYRAVGPKINSGPMAGQRALGKYQVMESNVGPWTEAALGQRLTPMQFLGSNDAQEAVFKHKFGEYEKKYGPEGAARAWFAGEGGMNNPNARDQLGTTVAQYGQKFSKSVGAQQGKTQLIPVDGDPFAQPEVKQADTFLNRFGAAPAGQRAEMAPALNERAAEMMRGPATSPGQNLDIAQTNYLAAATQGTSPNVSDYGGKLISKETFQSDSGEILYRDPADGQVKTTDSKTQVAIRDPADNTVKIFQRSDDTNESGATGAARVLAPGLAAGAPGARAVATSPAKSQVRASDIFKTAKAPYREFDALAPQSAQAGTKDTVERIAAALESGKQPTTFPGPKYIQDTVSALQKEGDFVTVDKLRDLKERLGGSFKSMDNRERAAAAIASREISKIISEAAPEAAAALQKGDNIFSTAKDFQQLQRARSLADLRTGRTGYGGNAVNNMRQEIGKIVDKIEKGGFTTLKPDEVAAMREIDQGNRLTNSLRLVGQFSPTKGIMSGGVVPVTAGIGTGGVTAAVGALANKAATVLTGRQIDQLMEKVAKRSPEYQKAVSASIDRWHRAQADAVANPSPAKIAYFIAASRQLSNGLSRDGIKITSGDLIKLLEGPVKSAADGDEQPVPGNPSQ